jgi:hypothetical protein
MEVAVTLTTKGLDWIAICRGGTTDPYFWNTRQIIYSVEGPMFNEKNQTKWPRFSVCVSFFTFCMLSLLISGRLDKYLSVSVILLIPFITLISKPNTNI